MLEMMGFIVFMGLVVARSWRRGGGEEVMKRDATVVVGRWCGARFVALLCFALRCVGERVEGEERDR